MAQDSTVNLRVAKTDMIAERADALVPLLGKRPEYQAFRVTRSVVLRYALQRGLDSLEEEFGKKRRGR